MCFPLEGLSPAYSACCALVVSITCPGHSAWSACPSLCLQCHMHQHYHCHKATFCPPRATVIGSWAARGCCLNRARTVRPFAYSVSTKSTMPESELPWLVAGLPVYYHRSNGDRVSATVVDPSPRGGRRVSIRYELGGEEVLYEHAPEERLEFANVTAESPDSPQPVHHEAPMDALLEPQLPEVEAEAPRIDDHEPECCGG